MVNKDIVFYGAGLTGLKVFDFIKFKKISLEKVKCFIDNNIDKNSIENIPIYKNEYLEKIDREKVIIIICTGSDKTYLEISNELKLKGFIENINFISIRTLREQLGDERNPYYDMFPTSTYAPWLRDLEFINCYNRIKENTLVDIYRCYELWHLVEQSSKLDQGIFLEIGVWRGGTGYLIAQKAKLLGINDNIYLCDTFSGVPKVTKRDEVYKGGEHSDTSEECVKNLLDELQVKNVRILKGIFPEDTAKFIKEKSIRFCHIDVDVYQSAKDIINYIWDYIIVGGIIVFDDFGFKTCNGITQLVEEQFLDKNKIIVENLNGHAIIIKLS